MGFSRAADALDITPRVRRSCLCECVRPPLRPVCAPLDPNFRLVAVRLLPPKPRLPCAPSPAHRLSFTQQRARAATAPRLRAAWSRVHIRILPEASLAVLSTCPVQTRQHPSNSRAAIPAIPPFVRLPDPQLLAFLQQPRRDALAAFALVPGQLCAPTSAPLLPPLWQPIARRPSRAPLLWTLHSFLTPLSPSSPRPLCALGPA